MLCNLQSLLTGVILLAIGSGAGAQGRIVAHSDDWTLSSTGFALAPTATANFAKNIAKWFAEGAGKATGSFLVHSQNFGLTSGNLRNAITADGHTWTVDTTVPLDFASLAANFDGLFLLGAVSGGVPDNQMLIDYVNNGGNVYLGGGAGGFAGGGTGEAQAWNTFLRAFGLEFEEAPYNGRVGLLEITPPMTQPEHRILDGVSRLYFNNASTVLASPGARALEGGDMGVSQPSIDPLGMGCPGSVGPPILGVTAEPHVDSVFTGEVTNVPMDSTLIGLAIGFNEATPPIDLGIFGLWNCTLYIDPSGFPATFGIFPMTKSGTTATLQIGIANDASLVGLIFYLQSLVQDSGAPNPVGFIVSNALRGEVN